MKASDPVGSDTMLHPFPTATLHRELRCALAPLSSGEPCSPTAPPSFAFPNPDPCTQYLPEMFVQGPSRGKGPLPAPHISGSNVRIIPILCYAYNEQANRRSVRMNIIWSPLCDVTIRPVYPFGFPDDL